jgi:hypothetical protein
VFRRRHSAAETPTADEDVLPVAPESARSRIAGEYGLRADASDLAEALVQADALWTPPRPGTLAPGVTALWPELVPPSLVGVRLWPALVAAASGPALVLADVRGGIRVILDLARADSRPGWVAAAAVARAARMPGSHQLWRHWQPELAAHAAHDLAPSCDGHTHLARPDVRGQYATALPQHDAWQMSRSWVPAELNPTLVEDTHWVVLGESDRPLRERNPEIRGRWDVTGLDEFAAALVAPYSPPGPLPPDVAAVVRAMLPVAVH